MRRSESTTRIDGRSSVDTRARCSQFTDCRCGQGLDVSVRAHCPRCGRSVTRT